jgi:hypothetical protein
MKNQIIYLLSVGFFLVQGLNGQFFASDEYIGADPTHNGYDGEDRIGDANVFEISGWRTDEDVNADTLTVSIQSTYFDNYQSGNNLLGTTLGDLFISTNGLSWNNPADTVNDSFAIPGSTKWDMAVDLPDSFSQAGSAGLFAITDSNILLAQDVLEPTNNIYRADQEVLLKDLGNSVATAQWSFNFDDPQNGILSVTFNNVSSLFGTGNDIGFHWTMTCANDVIEFEHTILTPVPEPATLGLLGGFGLMGYLFIRRRFKARK